MIITVRPAEPQREPDDILILDITTDVGDAIVEVDALDKDNDLSPMRIGAIIRDVRETLEAVQRIPLRELQAIKAEFERKRTAR